MGVHYQSDGTRSSGLFSDDNMLEMPFELKEVASNDFLDMGKDLMNPERGPRYFKCSDRKEHGWYEGDFYIGEWSSKTKKPHGRCIYMYSCFTVIGYFNNGE